uniref:RNA polymerase subunit H/Rpb5 C-terminal domain-containing protein n=1 Tax=viral metagenome TaxID=1070528 RepID=A0A6C0L1X7_9ZZZZ|tara:strand:- start:8733 stop:9389 length:657 start_codon:yes stop_codon:yes gene_type:complete
MSGQRHLTTLVDESRPILIKMLEKRGFDVSKLKTFSPNTRIDNLDSMSIKTCGVKDNNQIVQVHYEIVSSRTNHKKLTKIIEDIVNKLNETDRKKDLTLIFIVRDCMTPSVKEAVRNLQNKYNIFIQIFPIRSLTYDVTKHSVVPEHIRIPINNFEDFGVSDFLDSLHIPSLEKLPIILDNDPQAMFIGLRPGELCKIVRPSLSAGVHIAYRYCLSAK